MSIAGDCRLMIAYITSAEEIEKYREQYKIMNDIDLEIHKVIDEVGIDSNSSGKNFFFLNFFLNFVSFQRIFLGIRINIKYRSKSIC